MVRFSDLLGGSGDPDDARPTTLPNPVEPIPEVAEAEPVAADVPEVPAVVEVEVPKTANASPEDVLDRLTQYATSTRAGDQTDATPAPEKSLEPEAPPDPAASIEQETIEAATPIEPDAPEVQNPDEFLPVGDDLLPRSKGPARRSRKRRP